MGEEAMDIAGLQVVRARRAYTPSRMTPTEIVAKLQQRFCEKSSRASRTTNIRANAPTGASRAYLHDDPAMKLDWLQCLSGVDYVADAKMCCVYDLWSFSHRHSLAVKIFTPRSPSISSVADI